MKQWWKRKTVRMVMLALILAGVITVLAVNRFLETRQPFDITFYSETKELVITPGPFYTLDGHKEETTYGQNIAHIADAETEFRFRVLDQHGVQYLTLYYHDFTGEPCFAELKLNKGIGSNAINICVENPPWLYRSWTFYLNL